MKRFRNMKIKEIIQNQDIETQEELAQALRKEGINVTQATVSRDIKNLMLIKVPYKNGHYKYALSTDKTTVMPKNHTAVLFQQSVTKIDNAMNLVVIHTLPGSADAVAYALDHSRNKAVLGTLAGDDTVLVILKTVEDVQTFLKDIQDMMKSKK